MFPWKEEAWLKTNKISILPGIYFSLMWEMSSKLSREANPVLNGSLKNCNLINIVKDIAVFQLEECLNLTISSFVSEADIISF